MPASPMPPLALPSPRAERTSPGCRFLASEVAHMAVAGACDTSASVTPAERLWLALHQMKDSRQILALASRSTNSFPQLGWCGECSRVWKPGMPPTAHARAQPYEEPSEIACLEDIVTLTHERVLVFRHSRRCFLDLRPAALIGHRCGYVDESRSIGRRHSMADMRQS